MAVTHRLDSILNEQVTEFKRQRETDLFGLQSDDRADQAAGVYQCLDMLISTAQRFHDIALPQPGGFSDDMFQRCKMLWLQDMMHIHFLARGDHTSTLHELLWLILCLYRGVREPVKYMQSFEIHDTKAQLELLDQRIKERLDVQCDNTDEEAMNRLEDDVISMFLHTLTLRDPEAGIHKKQAFECLRSSNRLFHRSYTEETLFDTNTMEPGFVEEFHVYKQPWQQWVETQVAVPLSQTHHRLAKNLFVALLVPLGAKEDYSRSHASLTYGVCTVDDTKLVSAKPIRGYDIGSDDAHCLGDILAIADVDIDPVVLTAMAQFIATFEPRDILGTRTCVVDATKPHQKSHWPLTLMDAWELTLIQRTFRAYGGINFIRDYVILPADLLSRAADLKCSQRFGRDRLPFIVLLTNPRRILVQTYHQSMFSVQSVLEAVIVWAVMVLEHHNGQTTHGVSVRLILQDIFGPMVVSASID